MRNYELSMLAKEKAEAGEVTQFRNVILEYLVYDRDDNDEYLAEDAKELIDELRTVLLPGSSMTSASDISRAYRNRDEMGYWMQNQINELLACGNLKNNNNRLVGQVYRYVVDNINNPDTNLNSIATHFSISNSHLSRLLKKQLGRNYVDIISDIRLAMMIELLNTTNMKDRDIGERIGIYDPHYLSIWFKKVTGLSPSEYRRLKER